MPREPVDLEEVKSLVKGARRAGLIRPSARQLRRERLEEIEDFMEEPGSLCPVCDHRTRMPASRVITRGKFYGRIYWTCEGCGAEHTGEGSLIK